MKSGITVGTEDVRAPGLRQSFPNQLFWEWRERRDQRGGGEDISKLGGTGEGGPGGPLQSNDIDHEDGEDLARKLERHGRENRQEGFGISDLA